MKRPFILSAAVILAITLGLKAIALFSPSHYMAAPAPFLPFLKNGHLTMGAILFEAAALALLIKRKSVFEKLILIAFVGGCFGAFHIGLFATGYSAGCPCLGGPVSWLPLSQTLATKIAFVLIAYMLIGSYVFLLISLFKTERIE
jgi:hypothetical protein